MLIEQHPRNLLIQRMQPIGPQIPQVIQPLRMNMQRASQQNQLRPSSQVRHLPPNMIFFVTRRNGRGNAETIESMDLSNAAASNVLAALINSNRSRASSAGNCSNAGKVSGKPPSRSLLTVMRLLGNAILSSEGPLFRSYALRLRRITVHGNENRSTGTCEPTYHFE
ncbi:hypothetical protein ACFWPK_01240 [Nocardia sp. NPDC058519]|uniref:hypothetical protein n=1 Tax=Nocardia sp. NPDC058519 TaxID=3346535 RepID=UPI00365F71F4